MRDWLASAALARPALAVVTAGRTVTYAQLDEGVTQLARRLVVEPGTHLPTTLRSGVEFCELLHALPRRGAALMPLDPQRQVAPLPALGPEADVPLHTDFDAEAVHTVMHTSGTTGTPIPIELTFGNHRASALASADALGVEPDDRWLCPLPLFHVGGLGVLIRCAVNGTTAVLHEGFHVQRVKAALESGQASLASLVPTMLQRLREAGLSRAPRLRTIALGGGPIPAGLLEWAETAGIPVTPVYGMTETASQVVAGSPGRPLRGVELRIEEGEVLIRGPMVARSALAPDGWLHTGDLGRLDEQGRLHVEGRRKELIVSGGENVAPLEVEQALLTHPAVADAGVAGLPDPEWGEAVTAFVVLREPARLTSCGPGAATAWRRPGCRRPFTAWSGCRATRRAS